MDYHVFRYPLALLTDQMITMPAGAEILCVKRRQLPSRDEQIDLWAVVDPQAPLENRNIIIEGTGQALPSGGVLLYLDTVLIRQDTQVYHIFERLRDGQDTPAPETQPPQPEEP
jgi:hypothetical protein